MTAFAFSTDQLLQPGTTVSENFLDLRSDDTPDLATMCCEIGLGSTGIAFNQPALLETVWQSSFNGVTWGNALPLTPPLWVYGLGLNPGDVLARGRLPDVGDCPFVRLAFKITSGTWGLPAPAPINSRVSASLVALPTDRFNYKPSGFEVL